MIGELHGFPAYGRRYRTLSELLRDWNKGSDFKLHGGPYFSKSDMRFMLDSGADNLILHADYHIDKETHIKHTIDLRAHRKPANSNSEER